MTANQRIDTSLPAIYAALCLASRLATKANAPLEAGYFRDLAAALNTQPTPVINPEALREALFEYRCGVAGDSDSDRLARSIVVYLSH
jgi:hypothetical protein